LNESNVKEPKKDETESEPTTKALEVEEETPKEEVNTTNESETEVKEEVKEESNEESVESKPEQKDEEEKNEKENTEKENSETEEKDLKGQNTKMDNEKGKTKGDVKTTEDELNESDENLSENSSMENDENESGSNLVDEGENEEEPQKTESLKEMNLKDVLKINSMKIDFGELFPGQILEETVIILNNLTNTKVPFKIKINCLSKEFDDLDEYVYSMRRPTTQDVFNYNDTFLILLAQKAISYYKLAIKVPNIMEEKEILGNIEISCSECQNGVITIPIKSTIGKFFELPIFINFFDLFF